ncbi:1-deoxy-D-xylulose-5-phosphate reductoisomerase [Heliobacterium gestii]|uniref:1-deoxy-D-xylulose 5-phosphate reductoisomerase n=1 Tax=Heliomicrobium gestii TaxID=2699 RepID=A0A845LEU9_HELGE|nr:1-deoxy-D-xylulose-5-phosphate reductoisomerase [Heliomicrobium gestii]MBM7867146.1 1-deoxy-D-xylulose-5-phosphate reductoisomerase [Heliomicrobium gestii]MZP43440.1 1-deoxy-D-xylulose-5-phosphate reductoisomerase [Heliomicrobium gestii]
MKKGIAILGSTGSIGRQTLEVVDRSEGRLTVQALAAGSNWKELLGQIEIYRPRLVAMMDTEAAERLDEALRERELPIPVVTGEKGLAEAACLPEVDTVVTAVSGAIGLGPTMAAIEAGKEIALANKETLVAAGPLVMAAARRREVAILPVDSEHSAIFQCLQGQDRRLARLLLTASGGPFRDKSLEELRRVTPEDALRHPNWRMGPKITIDSASLMNKGLEVIEARWLFDIDFDDIEVLVHPQSIVHSMVELADGSILGQMGLPDMRLPIQYALSYPERWQSGWPRLDLTQMAALTFRRPDLERFPSLELALTAGRTGGTLPAVMNAANEVAVHAFLDRRIGFMDIPRIVREAMEAHEWRQEPDLPGIRRADEWARRFAAERIGKGREVSA